VAAAALPMHLSRGDDIMDVYRLWRERNVGAQGNTS
jgi:hypothetical protein